MVVVSNHISIPVRIRVPATQRTAAISRIHGWGFGGISLAFDDGCAVDVERSKIFSCGLELPVAAGTCESFQAKQSDDATCGVDWIGNIFDLPAVLYTIVAGESCNADCRRQPAQHGVVRHPDRSA